MRGWCSRATFTFQFRLRVFLFAICSRLLRHQSSNQTALRLSRTSVVSVRAGFGVDHNFTLRPKWWWIIHPGLFHLGWQKWSGGWWECGLRPSGKLISVHWLRVGALSPSAGVVPVATTVARSVIKAHARSSYFIKGEKKKRLLTALPKEKWRRPSSLLRWALLF